MQLEYVVRIDTDLRSVSWATVSESDLRYNCFLGDVILTDGIIDLSARWGWISIYDFALSMQRVLADLSRSGEAVLTFTESDATIRFTRAEERVEISTSYAPGFVRVVMSDLEHSSRDFATRLSRDGEHRHPDLTGNPHWLRLRHA